MNGIIHKEKYPQQYTDQKFGRKLRNFIFYYIVESIRVSWFVSLSYRFPVIIQHLNIGHFASPLFINEKRYINSFSGALCIVFKQKLGEIPGYKDVHQTGTLSQ